jgi:hypothetical protein
MNTSRFGRWLVYAGVAGFGIAAVQSFTVWSGLDRGAVPAASIFLVMVGMCFALPSLLEEDVGRVSTMRIGVLAIVMVFVVVTIKQGWNAGSTAVAASTSLGATTSSAPLIIDEHWIYILGLALGSKAAQKLVETRSNVTTADRSPTQAGDQFGDYVPTSAINANGSMVAAGGPPPNGVASASGTSTITE